MCVGLNFTIYIEYVHMYNILLLKNKNNYTKILVLRKLKKAKTKN